jgi:hypothetical protein
VQRETDRGPCGIAERGADRGNERRMIGDEVHCVSDQVERKRAWRSISSVICLQHEVDQLDGIFWIYRLSRLKRDRVVKRFDKMQRTEASGD